MFKIIFWICFLMLWIHKGYYVVIKLVWNVCIQAFWWTKHILMQFDLLFPTFIIPIRWMNNNFWLINLLWNNCYKTYVVITNIIYFFHILWIMFLMPLSNRTQKFGFTLYDSRQPPTLSNCVKYINFKSILFSTLGLIAIIIKH